MKLSPYEEKIDLVNKFIEVNPPSKMYDSHDVKETYTNPDDIIKGTIDELIQYINTTYLPPSKDYEKWTLNEKHLLTEITTDYLNEILNLQCSPGFILFYLERTDKSIEGSASVYLKRQPIHVLKK